MGIFTLAKLATLGGVSPAKIALNVGNELVQWINSILGEEREKRADFEQSVCNMSDSELTATFVPDVYQKDIYSIDYQKLWDKGLKLISFDIDDTIGDVLIHNIGNIMPGWSITTYPEGQKAKELVEKLHNIGFEKVVLLTNAGLGIARGDWKEIGADDCTDPYSGYSALPITACIFIFSLSFHSPPSKQPHGISSSWNIPHHAIWSMSPDTKSRQLQSRPKPQSMSGYSILYFWFCRS